MRTQILLATTLVVVGALSIPAFADLPGGKGHGGHGAAGHHPTPAAIRADDAPPARTVEITVGDLYVQPDSITAKAGETIRLVVRNEGSLLHAVEIGTPQQQIEAQAHTAMMVDHGMVTDTAVVQGQMAMDHGDHDMGHGAMTTLLVEPGKTAEAVWTFSAAGSLEIACSMPGHYEAGMAAALDVTR